MKIAIVAGEASGDILAAGLIKALKQHYPNAQFVGVCGPKMVAEGAIALESIESLAVFGLVEIVKDLPRLLKLRKRLTQHFLDDPPDVFIGVDAPEFNLGMEKRLRETGIKTVHYVSPSVWAWRQGRIKGIKASVDLMLTLLPFEAAFYREHNVPVKFVGHPLADELHGLGDAEHKAIARQQLGLSDDAAVVAVLPGSRGGELQYLLEPFLASIKRLWALQGKHCSKLRFVLPAANARLHKRIDAAVAEHLPDDFPVEVLNGQSREAMQASDVILLASGTATLEAMLLNRPMVVGYKLSPVTYHALTKLKIMKIKRYSLPNLLAGKALVPEFIQSQLKSNDLANQLLGYLANPQATQTVLDQYAELTLPLRADASQEAAAAVQALLQST